MAKWFLKITIVLILIALPSCAIQNTNISRTQLKILLLGFEEEKVTIRLNKEKVYQKYIEESEFSTDWSDSIILMVDKRFFLSVESKTTSIEESIELSEDSTVVILRRADRFVIRSSNEPLVLD